MRIPSARLRADFYDQLGVYLEAGTPIQEALASLASSSPASVSALCQRAMRGIQAGQTFANALAMEQPTIPKFEQAVLHSSELTGRLPQGCKILTETLNRHLSLRKAALISALYPIFIMHLAILVGPLMPTVMRGVASGVYNWAGYWQTVGLTLLTLHGWFWLSFFVFRVLRKSVGAAAPVEKFIRLIPLVGSTWWAMVVSRFAQAYQGMLNAGTNVVDGLDVASLAANSALLRSKILAIMPEVQRGQQIGELLQANHVLGKPWEEFWVTGEKSGRQDEMLQRIVNQSTAKAEQGFALLKAWIPKIIYFIAVIFVAIQIVMAMHAYVQSIMNVMDDKY